METPKHLSYTKSGKKNKNLTAETKFRIDLDSCSKNKNLSGAISLYDTAISQNIRFNAHHFNALLYICSISIMDSSSLESSKEPAIEYGFRIFDHMISSNIEPNEATITAVARLAAAKDDGDLAFELVRSMGKYNVSPRLRTLGPALFCFCGNLEADKAYEVEEHMGVVGLSAEEPELAALLKVSMETGREEKVYEYLHKLRSSVRCVSELTAEIVERWFRAPLACGVKGGTWDAVHVKEATLRNGGGWHGLGWMGDGEWVVRRSTVRSGGRCCACGEQLICIDIDREGTEKFAQSIAGLALERELKSNFREFQDWLNQHADYEAIVDGANIALYQQNFAEGEFSVPQSSSMLL